MVGTFFFFMECWIDLTHWPVLETFRYIIIIHYTYTSLIIVRVYFSLQGSNLRYR